MDSSKKQPNRRRVRDGDERRPAKPAGERRSETRVPNRGEGRGAREREAGPEGRRERPIESRSPRAELALEEGKIYGVNACLRCFEHRPEALIRVYLTEDTARRFGEVMKFCAGHRLAYHLVGEDEMERITGSTHHEGVCFLVKKLPALSATRWLKVHGQKPRLCVLALENVGNPHNLGAILRIAAHFGVPAVAVNDAGAMQSGAAVRTAEGGAEFVEVVHFSQLDHLVREFKQAGFTVVTTTSHGGSDLFLARMPEKALILFGEESRGLSKQALAGGDLRVKIPGTDQVESLNVSTATAIVLAEYWRQHH